MLKRNERMEKLVNAGVNTGKYFTVDLPEGLAAGTKIHLVIDENGVPQYVSENKNTNENDPILNEIIEDGYVRNTKLYRRFVTAQMFKMLNYKSYDGRETGYHAALKRYAYSYTFDMMLEEVRVLSKLEVKDRESFEERSRFFTQSVVVDVCRDYLDKLDKFIESKPSKNCKGIPYKRIKGDNIFVEDINKKVFAPLRNEIFSINRATSYANIYKYLKRFMDKMVSLPYDTPKSKAWIDAYKGNGSYFTCKNLIMFHNCRVDGMANRTLSMDILNDKLKEYQGEGWRMFAFMKKLIADNNFDFYKVMEEKYNK